MQYTDYFGSPFSLSKNIDLQRERLTTAESFFPSVAIRQWRPRVTATAMNRTAQVPFKLYISCFYLEYNPQGIVLRMWTVPSFLP